jgi:magnesium-protoporphyrin IX monomethyl ester (oxidative) cyclase
MTATASRSPALGLPANPAPAAPHLRENLLTPRFYTTEIGKAARTDIEGQRAEFDAMLGEMEADYNRDHFDRRAPLDRLRALAPQEKGA